MAETASAMLPYAVMMTTGSDGSASTAVRSTSIPVPEGSFRSVSTAEKCCLRSAAIASSAVPVASTAYCMRCSALVSISRSSNLSSTSSMDSMSLTISSGIVLWVLAGGTAKRKALLPQGHGTLVLILLCSRRAHSSFARLILQIVKLLAGIVECLLFRRGLVVVLALGRSPRSRVAKLIARIGVVRGLAQLPLAGRDIELTLKAADLALLRFDLVFDLVGFFLLGRRIGRGCRRSRLRGLVRRGRRWRGCGRAKNGNTSRCGQIVVGEHLRLRCRRLFGARFTRGIAKRLRVSRERQCAGYSDSS